MNEQDAGADGYYGDGEDGGGDLDLSFLDGETMEEAEVADQAEEEVREAEGAGASKGGEGVDSSKMGAAGSQK